MIQATCTVKLFTFTFAKNEFVTNKNLSFGIDMTNRVSFKKEVVTKQEVV